MDIGPKESWNTSKDDSQLVCGTSPTRTASSIHDNGCKSLHNIKAAVKVCEDITSQERLPPLDYNGTKILLQEPTAAPLPVIPAQEPTVKHQEEPILIETDGGAHVGSGVTAGTPLRLLIYKYESASLDSLQNLIINTLKVRKVESIAMVMSCVGSSIQITGKDETILNKDTFAETQIQDFFTKLKESYTEGDNSKLDFLACHAMSYIYTDSMILVKELEKLLQISVGMYRDILGTDTGQKDGSTKNLSASVGELYFKLDRLKGWTRQQQSMAGFEKIQTVGKGAYGAAVLYRKKDDDSLVILKEINMHDLNAAERQLALNEISILAMLMHPNIVSYYDSFEEDGVLMIEIEYADGGTLSQYLSQRDKPLEEREILVMFQQIVSAIKHIHEQNILHRDLKTANIFLTKEGIVKIGDFGISKMMSSANKGANTVLGTPYYISPEMCEGKQYYDKSDIWALGCILYEMTCLHECLYLYLQCEGKQYYDKSDIWAFGCILYDMTCLHEFHVFIYSVKGKQYYDKSDIWALGCILYDMTCLHEFTYVYLQCEGKAGQFAPVKGNYSQELKDLIMDMLKQDPDLRPSACEILNIRIPELMQKYEESQTDEDSSQQNSLSESRSKKKTRSVLYYFECCTASITPVDLPSKIKIIHAATGEDHVIVISTEKRVFSWGKGCRGQLGHDDTEDREKPALIGGLTGKSISRAYCGDGFSVFASDNGIVLTCGDGSSGCLGHGDWKNTNRPRLIETLLSIDVIAVACGKKHVVVVGSEGEVFSWGCGADGRLGLGNDDDQCIPTQILVDDKVLIRDVRCGVDGTMFITDVGSVFACGNNLDNKLGLNNRFGFIMAMKNIFTKTEVEGQKVPTPVKAIKGVLDISMGPTHTAVMVKPGQIYTFGRNTEGQLGASNVKQIGGYVEVKAMKDKTVNRVQCGHHYTVASTEDNELYYWGLRFKNPTSFYLEDNDSHSSTNGSVINTGDCRLESITPRKAAGGHSRQNSSSSVNEMITSDKGGKSLHTRQLSHGSGMDSFLQKDKETMLRRDSGNHSRHASSTDLRRESGSLTKLQSGSNVGENSATKRDSGNSSRHASSVDLRKDYGSQSKLATSNNKTHSRQTSLTSVSSIVSSKDPLSNSKEEGVESGGGVKQSPSHQRQTSVDSALSASLTDSGFPSHSNDTKPGFRPLSSSRRRTASASSKDNKDKEEILTDDAEIIYPPKHLLKIMKNSAEQLTISSFYCHGENLFIQMETTAPPPKRKSRKKRGIRKRYSGNTLNVPQETKALYSLSSHEGGDEYSSEASEMDTHGPVPNWIKQELALSEDELNDGNEPDDTSDHSDDEIRSGLVDASMSSIQINKELTKRKNCDDLSNPEGKLSKDFSNSAKFTVQAFGKVEVHQVKSLSYNSTESELDLQSDGSSKDNNESKQTKDNNRLKIDVARVRKVSPQSIRNRLPPGPSGANRNKVQSRDRGQGQDWKEQLAARGFVSDVTVKRKQEALKNELELTRGEKRRAQEKIKILEEEHKFQTELLKREVEKKAKEREAALEGEISDLRKQIIDQKSQMLDHQKAVMALQNDLKKVKERSGRDKKPAQGICPVDCPNGWKRYGGHCYYFGSDRRPWTSAKTVCNRKDGYLVKIDNSAENRWLQTVMKELKLNNLWIGANDRSSEGRWWWESDQSSLTFSDWYPHQPDDGSGSEDYAHLYSSFSYRWNDDQC
ncbi:Serine/threonine-protein kinase nekl-2,Probable serine/threonine-protein kinase nek3,Serine/threonine-protein kinase Nek1,Serine/threonine-protein kinase Nek6,Serine/threonine-protein kinase Nek7,Serine/threonine-protein kinase Nek8,Serine/threonine-protein kinase Nek11,Serine/threonine-protein kinase Nek3,Serine/threonine-protein kinase Nek4,Serine/threonine-protein kinase Nek9,Serine/threonine-protein kinase Nek5 [Mytilus coruscus]|uniref:non-specific serine/threonine protein kinase n=1 Tax=Mytilus coruscus TaxID=42192 RepID=A0A6J8A1W7_MYTCO|nr:Serine/threonine-protein kinase nekl-2,Probable serine/threonine-protein kinase nek3,Serine/threonine-protein kinase Nek1,Serine/threonine-protein kinase Nek6,Serine/threonine-protein kinase Nek7,Serine/threonine-protein kinase Nek8,Serine/threonine-protein kinase Nek11,Serine/threonine-protein kinase Nek3,Serine/threonine-protein kinase Nek4,Serine/threonine-protein kinase Nek9,Serine/threonine-protein kinase Nek5 [Mytilus coruscus]